MTIDKETTVKLLDAAKAMSGSDNQTAKRIFSSRQRISDYRAGRYALTIADTVLLAHLAGMDGTEWGSRAIEAQHDGTEKGVALFNALKKALVPTGAEISTCGEAVQTATASRNYFIRCILC